MIEFISYEQFPEDNYTKELVYLQIDGKRYGYISKIDKNGNIFWDVMSTGIIKNGKREYFKAVLFDSKFLSDDIITFLKARKWENIGAQPAATLVNHANYAVPASIPHYQQASFLDECPF